MNVLQIISSGGFYGAERMMLQLSSRLREMGCRVRIAAFQADLEVARRARAAGFAVEEIPCKGRLDFAAVGALRAIAREFPPDVAHSHGYKTNLYARLAFGKRGPKLVATCHLYTDETAALRFYAWLDCRLLRSYPAVAAVSDTVRDRLVSSGVPAEKVRVIDNGIDCDEFARARAPRAPRAAAVVGCVGRLVPQKNPEAFMAAARDVIARMPGTRFVYIGEGPEREKLERLRAAWGLEESVEFLGFQSDMAAAYGSLDVFVLPSRTEGLPMAILEAMAAGTPVIATRVGGVPRVVADGETGMLVEPGDQEALNGAILRLLADRELAARLAGSAQAWVRENFSSAAMARKYLDVYGSDAVSARES